MRDDAARTVDRELAAGQSETTPVLAIGAVAVVLAALASVAIALAALVYVLA